jgi:hypothetical protein
LGITGLGIAKLHFEFGAATEDVSGNWRWVPEGAFA